MSPKGAARAGLVPLLALMYASACGEPYGMEDFVAKLGPGVFMLLLFVTPWLWGLQAFAKAELSTKRPVAGGYYRWACEYLGPFWGYQEGMWNLMSSFLDNALYPVLFGPALAWPSAGAHGPLPRPRRRAKVEAVAAYGKPRAVRRVTLDHETGLALIALEGPDLRPAPHLIPYSCRGISFCPSCEKKRSLFWAEWLREEVLEPVPHRHVVLTMPGLRGIFRKRRELLLDLSQCGVEALSE